MAAADYRLCDVCSGKTFYDSNLGYEWGHDEYRTDAAPYRIAGDEQYDDPEMNQRHGTRLGYLGDWAVLCEGCATTHKTAIAPIGALNAHDQLVAALKEIVENAKAADQGDVEAWAQELYQCGKTAREALAAAGA